MGPESLWSCEFKHFQSHAMFLQTFILLQIGCLSRTWNISWNRFSLGFLIVNSKKLCSHCVLLLSKFLPSSIGFYDLFRTLHCHPSCIVVTNNIHTKKEVIFIKKFSLFSTQITRFYEKEPKYWDCIDYIHWF